MEIGTKPIPISVLTAVTNSALNAASVFPSRRIEISDSHTDEPVGRHFNIQVMDAALQDFEVSAVQRRETVEHPFGPIKAWMGATHFLMKTLPRVATQMALHVLA